MKLLILGIISIGLLLAITHANAQSEATDTWWRVQSVDTMKFSRDLAREKLSDYSYDKEIDAQVKRIADTGATHVAIGTPYDKEFIPYLKRWVEAARRHNLNVWFRGNFSGWEGWFDYNKISREQHLEMTEQFIKDNQSLFADGDIFTACPECENGGPGDPRQTGDVEGFREFLVALKETQVKTFSSYGKRIETGYFSMNGDVAKLIMDKDTTKKLGGLVTIDHYVEDPEDLAIDIAEYIEISGGKVVLGEYGAPIGDIHGDMTEDEQAAWVKESLKLISEIDEVVGVNYWANQGSSTAIWNDNGTSRKAVDILHAFYSPLVISTTVENEIGQPILNASFSLGGFNYFTDKEGKVTIKYIESDLTQNQKTLTVNALGYNPLIIKVDANQAVYEKLILEKTNESILFKIRKFLKNL